MRVAGPDVRLIDSAEETARTVALLLRELRLEAPTGAPLTRRFFVSDAPEKFEKTGHRFLGESILDVQRVDISQWL